MIDFGAITSGVERVWESAAGVFGKAEGIRSHGEETGGGREAGAVDGSFGSVFKAYMGLVGETNEYQVAAERLQLDFAAGKTDDMVAVSLAQEKAYTSLTFTTQVTNKLIEAYREISRIQL